LQAECPDLELDIRRSGQSMLESIRRGVAQAKVGRLAIEASSLTVEWMDRLTCTLDNVELAKSTGWVEQLREIKDRQEIERVRRSIELAERTFAVVMAALQSEKTERQLANEIEYQIRLFGGQGCSFPPIVAAGPQAALPHATPTDQVIGESDFVLIDWGARRGQYMSDLTRVLVTGKISPKLERIYGVVLKAQQAAIDAIRPGALMSEVDEVARATIAQAGYGQYFGHGLGHGIGLEIHESPRLAADQSRPLKAGMIITIEPGIYVPGWGGVRIEDDVLVTKDGHRVLSSLPRDLSQCVVSLC
jgi:Xaa-Pro aminopeptidase